MERPVFIQWRHLFSLLVHPLGGFRRGAWAVPVLLCVLVGGIPVPAQAGQSLRAPAAPALPADAYPAPSAPAEDAGSGQDDGGDDIFFGGGGGGDDIFVGGSDALGEEEAAGGGLVDRFLGATGTTVTGYLRNETAYRYVNPAAFSKVLNVVRMETFTPIGGMMELKTVPRVAYDAVYDLEDVDTIHPRHGPTTILTEEQTPELIDQLTVENVRLVEVVQTQIELREWFLDVHFSASDLRVGRQIVRWGVVEGSRVTDEVNPLDFKEFILREVVDRYVPLFMVRYDYYLSNSSLQFLWIPEVQPHKPAPVGTEFEQFQYLPGLRVPKSGVENAEYGLRYSFSLFGADMTTSYLDTWDDFPAAFRTVRGVGADAEFGQTPTVDFIPVPPRLKIPGISMSRSIGPFIMSAEAAYVHGKVFGTFLDPKYPLPPDASGGALQRDYYKWAVNADFAYFGIDFSVQYLRATILDYHPSIIADPVDTVHAGFVRKTFLDNIVTAQMLVIHFINDKEWVWRPRVDILMTQRVKLSVGADIMEGDIADVGPRGEPLPGQFHFAGFFQNTSRAYVEVAYQF